VIAEDRSKEMRAGALDLIGAGAGERAVADDLKIAGDEESAAAAMDAGLPKSRPSQLAT
jgi:hypothetical protein